MKHRPCCDVCNRVKLDIFTEEEMLVIGRVIRGVRITRPDSRFSPRTHRPRR